MPQQRPVVSYYEKLSRNDEIRTCLVLVLVLVGKISLVLEDVLEKQVWVLDVGMVGLVGEKISRAVLRRHKRTLRFPEEYYTLKKKKEKRKKEKSEYGENERVGGG